MRKLDFLRHEQFGLGLIASSWLWGSPGRLVGLAGLTAIATLPLQLAAQAATLTQWRFDSAAQQLEITVPEGTTPRYFLLAQPARIVLDLPNTDMGAVAEQQTYGGSVRQIRVGQFQPGLTRIVIELAPDVVLAPGQVQLERVAGESSRWVVRPLLANSAPAVAAQPAPAAPTSAAPAAPPPSSPLPQLDSAPLPALAPAPAAEIEAAPEMAAAAAEPVAPNELPEAVSEAALEAVPEAINPSLSQASLPPLEPDALEIAVEQPRSARPAAAPPAPEPQAAPEPVDPPDGATAVAESEPAVLEVVPASPLPTLTEADGGDRLLPQAQTAEAAVPTPAAVSMDLPPATFTTEQAVTVRVPPLSSTSQAAFPPPATVPDALPPASAAGNTVNTTERVSVPPLAAVPNSEPSSPPAAAVATAPQPAPPPGVITAAADVLLPAGTVLKLRYPREIMLNLSASQPPRQEVLLLAEAVRSSGGDLLLPENTQVVGRFETGSDGSRFITQAMTLQNRNISLNAQSSSLSGDRQVSDDRLLRNSALGALALTVLGGFTGIGLLGGAVAGAATTYATSPQPAAIQPNQIIEVRLVEDVPRSAP